MSPEEYQRVVQERIRRIAVALDRQDVQGDYETVAALMATLVSLATALGIQGEHLHDLVDCALVDYASKQPPQTMAEGAEAFAALQRAKRDRS